LQNPGRAIETRERTPSEWAFREIAYGTFCNEEIMKIGTRACYRNPRKRAARALLIYFVETKSTVQL
jgi:hypothetical protein